MILKDLTKNKIESLLAEKIISQQSVSGGCINDARMILTESQKKYFVKINYQHPADMFEKEANGLNEISLSKTLRVPKVISVDDEFILLEVIRSTDRLKNFFEDFGRRFAEMHKYSSEYFGFYEDNYIGSTPQLNIPSVEEKNDWVQFYFNKRLLYQIHLAERNEYLLSELKNLFKSLESKIDSILETKDNIPSLLHGDLWSGNYMIDENGNACLIDPAVYYGHREADLAMTKLFGGFGYNFYDSYNEEFQLEDGYEYRENIYKLYHVLNHLNLFGMGYYQQAVSLIKYYL
jgi:fructosamine-3-kinase